MSNKEKLTLENRVANSKLKISKNFLYYMIAPLVVLIVGVILLCTVGFNLGVDFTGGSTFKIYVNDENLIENAKVYDLDNKKDYKEIQDKIETVLDDNGLKIVSYRTSTINIFDYSVFGGQAIEVVYKNKAIGDNIQDENNSIREQLLTEFGYDKYESAISSISRTQGHKAFNYSMEILGAIVVVLALAIIYLLLRKHRGITLILIMQMAIDILLLLCMLVLCRLVVNLTIGIAFLTATILSLMNSFIFLEKIKNGQKTGKFEGLNNNQTADTAVKGLLFKKALLYLAMLVISILFVALAVSGVRQIALAIILALIVTFYSSTFLMPGIWAVLYRPKKVKKEN